MIPMLSVDLHLNGKDRQLVVGRPEGQEIQEAYRYRYRVYLERGHIDANASEMDIDPYDMRQECDYFIAVIDGRIVGHVRYIRSCPLPTERYFCFDAPPDIKGLDSRAKVEIGRLIATKYDSAMPRHLTMVCLIKALHAAIRHCGLAITLTSATTAAGLLSLSFCLLAVVSQYGISNVIGVLLMLFYTISILPAAVAILPIRPEKGKSTKTVSSKRTGLQHVASFGFNGPDHRCGCHRNSGIVIIVALLADFLLTPALLAVFYANKKTA